MRIRSLDERINKLEQLENQRNSIDENIQKLKKMLTLEKRKLNRPKLLAFHVTESEFNQVIDICEKHNISRSELLREIVFGEIRKITGENNALPTD
jgi:hypothetical protein